MQAVLLFMYSKVVRQLMDAVKTKEFLQIGTL